MRWDNLTISSEEERRLPGYSDPAVVRTFDAPEALDIRFYEVRARSALNRVPKRSQMPFRWTINPYRGCSHACTYCAVGDTPILMADGRTRPLGDLEVGDEIVGTERRGVHRMYVGTTVLDKWSTVKPAFRVRLEDGTELVTSGDHRLLTGRGWKHVTGSGSGRGRRPHLTTRNALLGTGKFASPPDETVDYRRGYLCGVIRGDGHLNSRPYERPNGRGWTHHFFRLALADQEALDRTQLFLLDAGVATDEFLIHEAVGGRRPIRAIRTQARASVDQVRELTRWPLSPTDDWRKGFLAGIFDAEGSCGSEALRIADTDRALLDWTIACFGHFGFDVVQEQGRRDNGLTYVRLRGGLRQRLRFLHTVDPAITRKRVVQGMALKSDAQTRVESVESLGMALRMYDITTGTGDFISNGVVSHNCFARPTHTYLDMDAGRDFEREIVVKVNAPELVRAELSRPSWSHEHIAMGTNTDPYQWVEGRYRLMPGIWEALRDSHTPCSILTKSPLLLRDKKLMLEVQERVPVAANLSVPTLDEGAWRETEPHTPSPRARLEAVAELNRAGIPTGVLIAPLMPGINDRPEEVERILELAADAGAVDVGGVALHLRGEVKGIFFDWLADRRPDLLPRYRELYRRGAYAPSEERRRLQALVRRDGRFPGQRRFIRGVDPAGAADGEADGSAKRAAIEPGRRSGGANDGEREEVRQESLF